MIYIKNFKTYNDYEEYMNDDPILPNVSTCDDEPKTVHYNKWKEPKALKFTATGDSTLGMVNNMHNWPNFEYSYDGKKWTTWNYITESALNIPDGKSIYIRGNNSAISSSNVESSYFTMTGSLECTGNIMHLLSYTEDLDTIQYNFCFAWLFLGCTSLTKAPELPATTLSENCYSNMFDGCTNLIDAPELPATNLAKSCYYYMFNNCKSIRVAPKLPATILKNNCYQAIFYNCTNLKTAPELPAMTLANNCYYDMFYNCISIETSPELPATVLANGCYRAMFFKCTGLRKSPILAVTTLVDYCYANMFTNCTNLNEITMLATDISATGCLEYWTYNVSSTGTFTKKSEIDIPISDSGIPDGWDIVEV